MRWEAIVPEVNMLYRWVAPTTLVLACTVDAETNSVDSRVGSSAIALRDMTAVEASEDLEQLFRYVRAFYGPYEYKQARFGYAIPELEEQARALLAISSGDDGFYEAGNWFLSRLDDGHVNLIAAPSSNEVRNYYIGIYLQPVEGKALIAELFDASLAGEGIAFGDEVLAVDGVSPFTLLGTAVSKLESLGNPLTNLHLIYHAFIRPGFAASIRPTASTAHVEFRRSDGSEYSRDLVWREDRDARKPFDAEATALDGARAFYMHRALDINSHVRGALASIGSATPFFVTPATSIAFDITPVRPNEEALARYGLGSAPLPEIFAALYSHAGKSMLLLRQSDYGGANDGEVDAELSYYRALMDQFDDVVDGLVVDQTHNPGGAIRYSIDFARLFAETSGDNFVEAYNADRRWINEFRTRAQRTDPTLSSEMALSLELRAARIEQAYDAGEGLSVPMPLYLDSALPPDESYRWTKPCIVLIDELTGSSADVFASLIKHNHLAPLFGQRTIGLGGNVEEFGPLPHSQASVALTRGLFTIYQSDGIYAPEDFIENNGVLPDIEHVLTAADFRGGFVDYMRHFSEVLIGRIDGRP